MNENNLSTETSPYLLQHSKNPVNWHPWNRESLNKAAAENKPILLSIGYSACHWCHVMAHESFEDSEIAKIMNQFFINIKIDREERPDIDGDIQSLRDAAAALNAELSRLTERLGAIEESLGAAGSGPVMEIDPVIEDREKGPDQTSTLAERIMQRLFEMIRELKGEAPAQQI